MRAALLLAPRQVEIAEVAPPALTEHDVLVAPQQLGLCGSDTSIFEGHRPVTLPHILGHELVGRVVAVGSGVSGFATGQRVIVEPNYPCGICRFCQSGRGRICPNKVSMGVTVAGGAAELVAAPAKFVWAVPDEISDEDAACVEPLAVALHAVTRSSAHARDTIAVVGCGAIGLLIVQVAVERGLRVLAHDLSPAKAAEAAKLGAESVGSQNCESLWREEGVAVVFECAGASAAVESCIAWAPRGCEVVLLGLSSKPAAIISFRLVREGVRITTSLIYDHPTDFAQSIELVARGALRPSSIVSHTYPLERMGEALDLSCKGNAVKVHIHIGRQKS